MKTLAQQVPGHSASEIREEDRSGVNGVGVGAVGLVLALASTAPAFAVDPTYTSQIKDALSAVNMTELTSDVSSFSGMGFTLLLTTTGVLFVAVLLRKFLK